MLNLSSSKNKIFAVGAGVNLIMFFVKLYIGLSVNSVAIYTDALNCLGDFAVCIASAIGFSLISAKHGRDYPFGKGKIEELLSLIIGSVIVVTGGAFAYVSLERFMYPAPVWYSSLYAGIIAATAAVKLLLALFFRAAARRNGSDVIRGISTDSVLDFFVTLCTLISFTLAEKLDFFVDGLAGLIISIILVVQGIKSTADAAKKLIGRRDDTVCSKAKALIEADSEIKEVRDIQCHSYGEAKIINAVIDTKCETAYEIHKLSSRLNEALQKEMNSTLYICLGGKNEKE